MYSASSAGFAPAISESAFNSSESSAVAVGLFRLRVSQTIPLHRSPAAMRLGLMPLSLNMRLIIVHVEPTGLFINSIGEGGAQHPYPVVVDYLHDVGLVRAGHRLRQLVVVYEH